jgi:hypothetical protein
MFAFQVQIRTLNSAGAVEGDPIILDCESKALFGYGEPDTEEVAVDNPDFITKIKFFGKSGMDTVTLSCLGDLVKWMALEVIKKTYPNQFIQVTFACEEVGFTQVVKPCSIGQLQGIQGTIAPKFQMSLIAKGGKASSMPVSNITNGGA